MLIGLLVAPAAQGACPSGATPSDRLATSTAPLSPGRIRVTDAEIEAVGGRIVAEVSKKTGATLRG